MQPRRSESGLGREAVEVDSARLETREQLFDDALDIVEFDGARGMKRALIRKRADGGKSQRGALFHFFGGAAEDGSELEEAHIADVAMEIAGDRSKHPGNERWTEHAGFFAERVAERNNLARHAAR